MKVLKLLNNLDKIETENLKLKKLLEDLTPRGSEFVNDPQYCFDFVKKELRSIPAQILPFKQRADKLKEVNDSLLEALKAIVVLKFEAGRSRSYIDTILETAKAAIQKAEQ